MKIINGYIVPENLSIIELEEMMKSTNMQTFAIACEALRLANTYQAYELLKMHLSSVDEYKQRYVLEVISDFAYSAELISDFENGLLSEKIYIVTTILECIMEGKIHIEEEKIFKCFERNNGRLSGYFYPILCGFEKQTRT